MKKTSTTSFLLWQVTLCLIASSQLLFSQEEVTYQTWKASNAIPTTLSPDSDTDGDGIPLLLEYALGLSPTSSSRSAIQTGPNGDETFFNFTYPRLRSDLFYEVQGSENLQDWSISSILSSPAHPGEEALAQVPLNTPLRFLRLKVSLQGVNASAPGTATAPFPTLENISLEWPIQGDENRDGIVRPRFRKAGDSDWCDGLPLERIPAGNNEGFAWTERHAGSLFGLDPDTLYDIELTLDDPDGGSAIQNLQARTRPVPLFLPHPSPLSANPANLAAILDSLSPGDFVQLTAGNYSGFSIPSSGTAASPIIIQGSPDALITGEVSLFSKSNVHLTGLRINGRIRFNGSDNIVITRCQIQSTIERQGHGIICFTRAENSYIADNTITGTTLWNEAALGNNGDNLGEGIAVTGPGHVIEHNRVRGFRDGISFLEDSSAVDQQSIDVLNNEISECGDDGIEADFAMGNCRIMRNRITNTFIAMSSQPSLGGPTYFIRNAAYNVAHVAFKLYRGSEGDILYHNTVVKNGDAFAAYNGPSAIIRHLRSRNNLFIGGPGGTYNGFSSGSGQALNITHIDLATSDLNGDAFGTFQSPPDLTGRLGTTLFNSLTALRTSTSETFAQEASPSNLANTIAYPGNPLTLYSPQDLRPSAENDLVGNALSLPNINQGETATIGAYEPNQALPQYGPRTP